MKDHIDGAARISSVTLAFNDLSQTCESLAASEASPKEMRRLFQDFVNNSQKLTTYMRKEFSAQTGGAWAASGFSGWNAVTNLFKELRNIGEHEEPIVLEIDYTWTYRNLGPNSDMTISFKGRWDKDSSLDDFPFDALEASAPDPSDKGKTIIITPTSVEHDYTLANNQSKIRELLREIGHADIIKLTNECLDVLMAYHDHYLSMLEANIV